MSASDLSAVRLAMIACALAQTARLITDVASEHHRTWSYGMLLGAATAAVILMWSALVLAVSSVVAVAP